MLTLSNQSDYGFLILTHLAKEKDFVSLSQLVDKTKLPQRFIARIASTMVRHGFLISREGRVGGYMLSTKVRKTNLYSFLKVFEGDISLVKCTDHTFKCRWQKICRQKNFIKNILDKIVIKELKKYKVNDLLFTNIHYE